ncbi:efflux transporter outer membrane subunit [Burkholderia mayonis]|uniref:RND transporter n=1 Tax=Burkholderia mayonis TaxID=1385591 RepID=A0A1B4G0V6_9BURK|nr:efflux transporter outer membrane subunit [Burkholderia mayonis]AOJ09528.1 RND transporter [Burkholderia mayonis]KVE47144.1 RND transporter [Burkholderia mayonis]
MEYESSTTALHEHRHRRHAARRCGGRRAAGALRAAVALLPALLAACAVGPDYRRPEVSVPQAWRLGPEYANWHPAEPAHASLDDAWWRAFGIEQLDALEQRALENNQTLREAAAHYDQARAVLASASSAQLPEVGVGAEVDRRRISANRPLTEYGSPNSSTVQNDFKAGVWASWEIDLFGRVRRSVEAARADAQQSADDFANVRLALTAQLASVYFGLRAVDDERDIIERSIAWQQKAFDFVSAQERFGEVSRLSVLQQRTQLDATRVQLRLLMTRRAQYEHAIATMIGEPAPQFTLAPNRDLYTLPVLPTGVPSELLQRRPDVAATERAMAAANARIGVARAAYFPSLTLSPEIGWQSAQFASLATVPSLVWSIGASVGQALFDGGRRAAQARFASAGYAAAEAHYRSAALTAFQEVQDAVTNLAVLDAAARESHQAVDDSRRLLALATYRYRDGMVAYLDVIDAQRQMLTNERELARIRGKQAGTVVYLARALGGGWRDPVVSANR